MRIPLPQVSDTPARLGQFTAPQVAPPQDATGAQLEQLGTSMQRLGMASQRVETVLQEEADQAEFRALDSELRQRIEDLQEEPERGLLQQQGRAAVDGFAGYADAVAKARHEIAGRARTPRQAELFAEASEERVADALRVGKVHRRRELVSFAAGESDSARRGAAADFAKAAAAGDVQSARAHRDRAMREVDRQAAVLGWPAGSAQRQELAQRTLTDAHLQAVDRMLAQGDVDAAEGYLQSVASEVDPQRLADAQRVVGRASLADQSLRLSMMVSGTHAEQLGAVDDLFRKGNISAELRDATVNRLEANAVAARHAMAESRQAATTEAEKWLVENPLAPLQDLPAALQVALEKSGALGDIRAFAANRRYVTNPTVLLEALRMPRQELEALSPAQLWVRFRGGLDDQDLERVQAMHARAQKRETPEQTHLLSVDDRVREAAARWGIMPRREEASEEQAARFYQFQVDVGRRIQEWERTKLGGTRKASPDEVQALLDQAGMDLVRLPGWGTDAEVPTIAMDPEQAKQAYVQLGQNAVRVRLVPQAERDRIVQTLLERGLPVTEARVVDLWDRAGRPGENRPSPTPAPAGRSAQPDTIPPRMATEGFMRPGPK